MIIDKPLCNNHNIDGKDICNITLGENLTIDKTHYTDVPIVIERFYLSVIDKIRWGIIIYSIFFLLFTIYMEFYRRDNIKYVELTYKVVTLTFPLVMVYAIQVIFNFYIMQEEINKSMLIPMFVFGFIGLIVTINLNKIGMRE